MLKNFVFCSLNQAVKRSPKRFEGEEFMFQLSAEEWRLFKVEFFKMYYSENEEDANLRSQFVTANHIKKQRFYPYAFTEIGVAMLSSVLKSEVAIQANRKIMKAFVTYRHLAELPVLPPKKFFLCHICHSATLLDNQAVTGDGWVADVTDRA